MTTASGSPDEPPSRKALWTALAVGTVFSQAWHWTVMAAPLSSGWRMPLAMTGSVLIGVIGGWLLVQASGRID